MNSRLIFVVIVIIAITVAYIAVRNVSVTSSVSTPKLVATVSYMCNGGKTISAQLFEGAKVAVVEGQPPVPTGSATLALSDGRSLQLPQTLSADGGRYANTDESFVFWSKGNTALVLENNAEKSFIGCIEVVPDVTGQLPHAYASSAVGFSLRLPALATSSAASGSAYSVDEGYRYQGMGPSKTILGVQFKIPASMATGTNLASDSYLSVESIPQSAECTASLFLENAATSTVTEGDTTYSFASTTDAGAGNRYEEWIYALLGTNPCMAVRYFIHYGAIQNYPEGMVKEFDHKALLQQFDAIRKTITIGR